MKIIDMKELEAQLQESLKAYSKAERYVEEIAIGSIIRILDRHTPRYLCGAVGALARSLYSVIQAEDFIPGAVKDGEDEHAMTSYIEHLEFDVFYSCVMNTLVEVVLSENGIRVSSSHSENIKRFGEFVGVDIEHLGNGQMSLTFPEIN